MGVVIPALKGEIVFDLTPIDATYTVIVSNGSGRKAITFDGTKERCWSLARAFGANGGIAPGVWEPIDIYPADDVIVENDGSFNIIG